MPEFIREAEEIAERNLSEALKLVQQAENLFARAQTATGDSGLVYRINDYMGALSLIRESGNARLNKLRDLLDPS